MTARHTMIDLFCGAGGIAEGFRQADFDCLWANDNNVHAIRTFATNHPTIPAVHESIEELAPQDVRFDIGLSSGELDCLAGGPPCQGFSINAPDRISDDPRNRMIKFYLDFVREFQPKTLLFENVPGMLSLAKGAVVHEFVADLESLGYELQCRVLFAAHYGVPQERWRLIILGSRMGIPVAHPVPTHYANGVANFTGARYLTFKTDEGIPPQLDMVTVHEAIGDLPELQRGCGAEEMQYTRVPHTDYAKTMRGCARTLANHFAPKIAPVNLERLRYIGPGGSWRDLPVELLPKGMQRARRSDHTRRYGRLKPDGLAGTIMTKMDPHWGPAFHYDQPRTLTVREAARLQSFPDRYIFTGPRGAQYEQVGNAVPVLMAKAVANEIKLVLENRPDERAATKWR